MQTKSQIREPISGNIRPASLSPDSEFIAYLSERTIIVERLSSGWKHFEINADGTPFFPSGLNHPRLEPIDLVFQENGSLLVFTREFDRRTFETNLVLIDWDIDQGSAVSRGNELLDLTDLSGVFSEDYMNERPQNVPAFTLSPLESRFISLTRDGKARTWDMEAKSLLAESSADYLDLMALSPNGKSVAVPDALGGIDILDLHTAVVIRRLEGDWYPTRIVYNSDSILLVLDAGNRLSFIDATNGRILESYVNDEIDNTATFTQSTHGRLHAAVRLTGGSKLLRVFSLSHQKPLLDFGRFPIPFQAQFSPDGQMLAGISRNRVLLWDLQTQLILGELEGAGRSIGPLVFTPNGNVLISSSGEIWEIEDRNLKAIFENSNPSSNLRTNGSVVLSQDGEFWDIETGLYLGKLLGIDSPARNFEFTPDGGQIIWQPEGGVIEIWEVVQ
jgi:WD40 repeat protein